MAGVAATCLEALKPARDMATAAQPDPKKRRLSLIRHAADRVKRAVTGDPPASETKYPPSPFAAWSYDDASGAIEAALDAQTIDTSQRAVHEIAPAPGDARFSAVRRTQDPIAVNRAFYAGDHWQNGSGYIGPHPAASDQGFTEAMTEISSIFTSQNAVREVTDRHVSGVIGRPFRWSFVPRRSQGKQEPTEEEKTAIDEATAMVQRWLTARKVPTLVSNAVATLLLAERSAIRLVVPAGLTTTAADGSSIVEAKTVEEGLAKIWPEHQEPEHSAVACDQDTKLEAGVVEYSADADYSEAADSQADDAQAVDYAWLCFLSEVGQTVIRILEADAEEPTRAPDGELPSPAGLVGDTAFDLGGRLTMFEMHRPALITPQVQQAQRALNFALTMVPRNVTTGGFLERLILDAQLPGEPEVIDGAKTGRWILKPMKFGAGVTSFVQGRDWTDENGVVHHASPSAEFREPVKPDASLTAKDAHYRSILNEVGQTHVLITADATASAVSRIQARTEYLGTLLKTKPEVEAALQWLIETALAFAEAIAETPGKYTRLLRADVTCRLDTGPIAPEERGAIEAAIGVTISAETAMLMLDVDDVDAEKTRIAADPLSRAKYAKAVGDALTSLTAAGVTLDGAAKFLGLAGDDLNAIMTPITAPPAAGTSDGGSGSPPAPTDKGAKPASSSGSKPGGAAQ